MADIHPAPVPSMMMPSLNTPGPEFPHGPADVNDGSGSDYGAPPTSWGMVGDDVMSGAQGGLLQESSYAHDVNAGAVAPYYAGSISPIFVGGDNDAGGRDDVSGTVAGAVAAAEARFNEYQSDVLPQGAAYGDLMNLPVTLPSGEAAVGSFYDPPRDY